MMTATTRDRRSSMSVAEAVENIMQRSNKARHICARAFAKNLIEQMPELEFWQFTPPDPIDQPDVNATLSKDQARQIWPVPVKLTGHFVGSWLKDVYAGSRAKARYGNTWDEPHKFNYFAVFRGDTTREWIKNLPLPLMRDFRANMKSMLAICETSKLEIAPKKSRSPNKCTPYIQEAIFQVSERAKSKSDYDIDAAIRSFEDDYARDPIHDIRFDSTNPSIVNIEYRPSEKSATKIKELRISTIRRRVRSRFNATG